MAMALGLGSQGPKGLWFESPYWQQLQQSKRPRVWRGDEVKRFWGVPLDEADTDEMGLLLFSCQVMSDSLQSHGLQHARLPCPPLSPWVCWSSCPLSWCCYLTISTSAALFSFCLQSFPASGSFPLSWLSVSAGQSIGASASASVILMNIQGCFPLGLTGLISLQSKGLSRIFFSTTIWKHQFFSFQPILWSNSHIRTWLLEWIVQ